MAGNKDIINQFVKGKKPNNYKKPTKVSKKKKYLRTAGFVVIIVIMVVVSILIAFNKNNVTPPISQKPTAPPNLTDDVRYTSFLGGNANIVLPSKINVKLDDKFSLFEIHFIDVGQGDSILIRCPDGVDILIDAGSGTVNPSKANADKYLLNYLESVNLDKIDFMVATHKDSDHINMLDDVLDAYEVDTIYYNTLDLTDENLSKTARSFEEKAVLEKANLFRFDEDGDIYTIKEDTQTPRYEMTIFAPGHKRFKDVNSSSPIIIFKMFDKKLVLTGDAHIDTEEYFEEEYKKQFTTELNADFLKVGHHGSNTSSSEKFLSFIKCEFAVISAGIDNKHGHPTPSTMEKFKNRSMETYLTAKQGQTILYVDYQNDFAFGIEKSEAPLNIINNENYFYYKSA